MTDAPLGPFDVEAFLEERARAGGHGALLGVGYHAHGPDWAELSLPYRPYHAHNERWWLTPNEPVECQVEVWPTSMVFAKGHRIRLDVPGRSIELLVSPEELAGRMQNLPPAPPAPPRGYARLYDRHVTQADDGLDFDFLMAADRG